MEEQSVKVAQLAALLGQTGSAHGQYEKEHLGGVYDENWPEWYARYLEGHGFYDLLGSGLLADGALAESLRAADTSQHREAAHESWPEYYARYFLSQPVTSG